ncbi:recombinase family protein [Actinomadura terrae]|uniref:recombinase family protein n=1 Tax=Actinomadura terrae TaxID=604353 RepID=UPI001FA77DE9|nr:recombinase family protein [Actinomadura terrae]
MRWSRVSTSGQILERQLDALTAAGCRRVFADTKSGTPAQRSELKARERRHPGRAVPGPLRPLRPRPHHHGRREIGFTSPHAHAGGWPSMSSPAWPSSSANSSSPALARAWPPPAPP